MRNVEPTGRWRHIEWRGRLVLQIEERGTETYFDCGFIETEWVRRWRNARVGDLTVSDKAPDRVASLQRDRN